MSGEASSQDVQLDPKSVVQFLTPVGFSITLPLHCKLSILEFLHKLRRQPQDNFRDSRGSKARMLKAKPQHRHQLQTANLKNCIIAGGQHSNKHCGRYKAKERGEPWFVFWGRTRLMEQKDLRECLERMHAMPCQNRHETVQPRGQLISCVNYSVWQECPSDVFRDCGISEFVLCSFRGRFSWEMNSWVPVRDRPRPCI